MAKRKGEPNERAKRRYLEYRKHAGRLLIRLGHEVKLIPPVYVKPYVKRGKTDAADAESICEAVTRPTMRFVEIKTPDQQAILALPRTRDLVVRQRTQTINMPRGRRLLVIGMMSRMRQIIQNPERHDPWVAGILARKPGKVAAVAMANKTNEVMEHCQP